MSHPASCSQRDVHYEFGGPVGAGLITITLPLVVLSLCLACGDGYCVHGFRFSSIGGASANLPAEPRDLLSSTALKIYLQWILAQVFLERALPGKARCPSTGPISYLLVAATLAWNQAVLVNRPVCGGFMPKATNPTVEGAILMDGSRLRYKINGHTVFWASLITIASGAWEFQGAGSGFLRLSVLHDKFEQLAVAAIVTSFLLSFGLYVASRRRGARLADAGGAIGHSVIYDFFIGRELNPRIGPLDLKFFCELRPGLIGWIILNLGMLCKQREVLGYVSIPMMMVNVFQGLYVWDALFFERAILTTMDITTDGFGFMLAFGDLCWVPFTYSLQARYLVNHDPRLSFWAIAFISCMNMAGYIIFRGANGQKDAFRRDPNAANVSHLNWMPTKRGTKLLTSGWWGAARKINYTGDWIMGLSWCMLTGFNSPIPYFYCIYFGILLIHRAIRDDHVCAIKYGSDWAIYKRKVPCIFVPGVV